MNMTDKELIELINLDPEIRAAANELLFLLAGYALPIRSALVMKYLEGAKHGKA